MGIYESLILSVQVTLAVIYLVSGGAKVVSLKGFTDGLSNFEIFPKRTLRFVSLSVIFIELALGVLFLIGHSIFEASILAMVFLSGVLLVTHIVLKNGLSVPCLCIGNSSDSFISSRTQMRILIIMVGHLIVLFGLSEASAAGMSMLSLTDIFYSSISVLVIISIAGLMLAAPDIKILITKCISCTK